MSAVEKEPARLRPTGRPELKLVEPGTAPAIRDFQTDAIALEERRPPITARLTLYLVATAIGAGVFWASVSRIDQIVVAPGKLTTSQPTLVVQPFETSIVQSIAVKPGDVVRKGQLLATLDPTFADADASQLQAKLAGFVAQIARMEAELSGAVYAPPLHASPEAQMQAELARQRRAAFEARLADFDAQIAHGEALMQAAKAQEVTLRRRLGGLREIQDMHSTLADSGNGSRLAFLQSRDLGLELEVTLTQVQGQYAEALHGLQQVQAERQNFVEDYRRQTLEALVELEEKQAGINEEVRKVTLRAAMSHLLAPADAAVLEVAQRSQASVVQAAEPLVTLVPLNVALEVEVAVPSNDIGHLALGDAARIKFDAFPFQEHGTVAGTVTSISENSFAKQPGEDPAGGTAFYRVRIGLSQEKLRQTPADFRLLPGMTVSAEIHAGERSVISYFLYPLMRGIDESLHEP
ncbi:MULTISPECIES: HlyD family type I secretion periplasmic adaptor subunit [unclassified Devosia]|uniref:HlyD family type I secretion periplasmic adaptor subunit n=1 Tax=unclassified Devosia TaxID=196773 RepID=UPI0015555E7C|nr:MULTISPECIES: HlyD family type I secretion periplasmic adaptor subunit [unclassified Devosia]